MLRSFVGHLQHVFSSRFALLHRALPLLTLLTPAFPAQTCTRRPTTFASLPGEHCRHQGRPTDAPG